MDFQISKAQETDVQQVAYLFDKYRQFYGQQTDTSLAEYFIKSRMLENNAFIFIAKDCDNNLCGFCIVYLTYSSILAKRIFVLNDLFVAEPYRSAGIGKALVQKVVSIARIEGVKKIELQTAKQNQVARNLYESLGFQCDEQFLTYERVL